MDKLVAREARWWALAGAAAVSAWLAACGGIAVIDVDDGQGGSGQGGGGQGGTPVQTTTNNVASSSASGIMPGALCAQACQSLLTCDGADEAFCTATCESQSQPCAELHQQWLSCSLGEGNSMCGSIPGQVCAPDLQAYLDCVGGFEPSACSVGPMGECSCFAVQGGGQFFYEQYCEPGQGCVCVFNGGEVIGTCTPQDSACGLPEGCCAGVFFTQGVPGG